MDDTQEQYIEIVAANWTADEYSVLARTIRAHFYSKIWARDRDLGRNGVKFTALWENNFSISEEILLAGEATLMDSREH